MPTHADQPYDGKPCPFHTHTRARVCLKPLKFFIWRAPQPCKHENFKKNALGIRIFMLSRPIIRPLLFLVHSPNYVAHDCARMRLCGCLFNGAVRMHVRWCSLEGTVCAYFLARGSGRECQREIRLTAMEPWAFHE